MKNSFLGKYITILTKVYCTVLMLCVILFVVLVCYDKSQVNLKPLQDYLLLEYDALGLPIEDYNKLINDNKTISSIIRDYEGYRLKMELNGELIHFDESFNPTQLLSFDTGDSNNYIAAYIKCLGYYDTMLQMDKSAPDYWESMFYTLNDVRPHEQIVAGSIHGMLYRNIPKLEATLLLVFYVTSVLGLMVLIWYYITVLYNKK